MALFCLRYLRSVPPIFAVAGLVHKWLGRFWLRQSGARSAKVPTGAVPPVGASMTGHRLVLDVWSVGCGPQSGVQRVSQQMAAAVIESCPADWTVTRYACRKSGENEARAAIDDLGAGDAFFALDLNLDGLPPLSANLRAMRGRGARCIGLMHDVLPLSNPEWFKLGFVRRFQRWAHLLAHEADHILCNSQATAGEVQRWLPGWSNRSADITVLPLAGAGLLAKRLTAISCQSRVNTPSIPYLLMVGTLEPRKGHAAVLAAFEGLWRGGAQFGLVIAGKPGWYTEYLQMKLRQHREYGVRLFWFDNADDDALAQLYSHSAGVIAASLAEGLGLSIGEARAFGKPVLARHIAPFAEQSGPGIVYFPAQIDAVALAQQISAFLVDAQHGKFVPVGGVTDNALQRCADLTWAAIRQITVR